MRISAVWPFGVPTAALLVACGRAQDPPVYDCDDLPVAPFPSEPAQGRANEDLSFDVDGYLMGADNHESLWRTSVDGERTLILPQSGVTAGLRSMWWDGRLASAQYETGAVYAIDPKTGAKELLLGNLASPTGLETGLDHSVWISEIGGGRILRLFLPDLAVEVVAEGFVKPQGLSFSPDYDTLYFAAIGESRIYALAIDPATMDAIGEPTVFAEDAGTSIDGLGVDACGNVYAGFWSTARLVRYAADGAGPEVLVDEPEAPHALGNFVWGSPVGGWPSTSIYVVETGRATVRRVDLGVPEKARPVRGRVGGPGDG